MNWPNAPFEDPKDGDIRCIQFFSWSPTVIGDRTYWLETVIVKQVFHVGQCEGGFHGWYNESLWSHNGRNL